MTADEYDDDEVYCKDCDWDGLREELVVRIVHVCPECKSQKIFDDMPEDDR